MSFIYSLIGKLPDIILCEHTDNTGNFHCILRNVMQKMTDPKDRQIIKYDKYNICYIYENEIIYICLTEDVKDKTVFSFLEEVKNEILSIYSVEQINKFSAYQLKKGFDTLKKFTGYYNSQPMATMTTGETIDQIVDVKNVLIENIDNLMKRDDKIDIIVGKSNNLKDISAYVTIKADNIRRNESSRKNKYVGFVMIVVGFLVIIFMFLN